MDNNRYIRQISLDRIGKAGQEKLKNASVAIIGCGGLGSIAAVYLAGAGIGRLLLADGDTPDISNLHRQVFFTPDTSASKADALKAYIQLFNPEVEVKSWTKWVDKLNIIEIIQESDLVLECTDQIHTKYLVNDACALYHKPMVYGAIHKYDGYISLFRNASKMDIHLRDIFPEPDTGIPSCSEVGVMNTLAGITGLLQANEAIKYISGAGSTLEGYLLIHDILHNGQTRTKLKKSWNGNLREIWSQSSYRTTHHCDIPEISVEDFMVSPSAYKVVSILNETADNIIPGSIHMPASSFNIYDWEPDESKPTIVYCTSGKVSLHLALALKEEYPECEFLSLKGGIKAYKKYLRKDQG